MRVDPPTGNANAGVVYQVKPEPIDESVCQWIEAGVIRIGVEPRIVDPERLRQAYADDPEALAEIEANQPEGGFHDAGVSLHVVGRDDGHEYLRFDVFDDEPHYHYVRPSGVHNHWVPFDPVAGGDMLAFALRCLRERLGPMLCEAGGEGVAKELDPDVQGPAIDAVEALALRLRAAG